MLTNKYAAAIVAIAIAAFAFLRTAFADDLDRGEVAQLVALVAGAVVTFFVPLLSGPWAGALKTGASLVGAAAAALAPFLLQGTITNEQWTIVILAALGALGVEVGVSARTSVIDAGVSTPGKAVTITNLPVEMLDPEGVKALTK